MGQQLDTACREVFVRAVCAKGRATSEQVHIVTPTAGVIDVLGCRVTGLRFSSRLRRDVARVVGEYELQVWVAFDADSELIRQRVDFTEHIGLRDIGEGCLDDDPEVLAEVIEGPSVVECAVNKDGQVEVVVSLEFRVDVVGKTRLFVQTCEPQDRLGAEAGDLLDDEWTWTGDDT